MLYKSIANLFSSSSSMTSTKIGSQSAFGMSQSGNSVASHVADVKNLTAVVGENGSIATVCLASATVL